jgi:hypothetical protein
MTDQGDFGTVIESMGIAQLPRISTISNISLRAETYRLIEILINMLLENKETHQFTLKEIIAIKGVPDLFNYPRIQLTDSETGDVSYFTDSESKSQSIKLNSKYGKLKVTSYPSNKELNLSQMKHPLTNSEISIDNIYNNLDLVPTSKLHEIVMESIKHVSNQIVRLKQVVCVPFRISTNQISLDINRAFGKTGLSMMDVRINASDLTELRQPMSYSLNQQKKDSAKIILRKFGEQCKNVSDDNCSSCIKDNEYICLRSLVARYLKNPTILSHKGIELSDIQGEASVGSDKINIFGFAKLANGKNRTLTARNNNGAILLSQVLGQIDKSTFNTVLIISPSILNEDLRERLQMICGVFNKRLLFFDIEVLTDLLNDFEIQSKFDGFDYEKMYKSSL